jgi:hypothetical protein
MTEKQNKRNNKTSSCVSILPHMQDLSLSALMIGVRAEICAISPCGRNNDQAIERLQLSAHTEAWGSDNRGHPRMIWLALDVTVAGSSAPSASSTCTPAGNQ